jgi:hypothetical protein
MTLTVLSSVQYVFNTAEALYIAEDVRPRGRRQGGEGHHGGEQL